MTTAKAFGSVLSRIRKEQGYSGAYQFFKSVGGSKSLGFAFVSYWDLERGKKLPKSWRLKAIIAALGLEQHSPKARELIRAYFKALSGSDELLEALSAPAAAAADLPSRELAEAAVQQAIAQRKAHLTIEQWQLCARDLVTYICQYFLFNTAGRVTVRELSDATGFKPEVVRKAVKALAAAGLADLSGDKVQGLFAKKLVELLPATPATASIKAALRAHAIKWHEGSKRVDGRRIIVRMSKANLAIYREHLLKAINLASIYSNSEEDLKDSAIYSMDAGIYQMLPRD
ncbi:MAG: hypothetical protein NTX59_00885 [Elusimicrobia bacterium]|nr:hypothetical protein [Elusimicrobiota bacterium]